MLRKNDSKFIRVRCVKCKNEQVVFGKAVSKVKCLVCGNTLSEPRGGKSDIQARVLEVLD